jgi:hypothetical protein
VESRYRDYSLDINEPLPPTTFLSSSPDQLRPAKFPSRRSHCTQISVLVSYCACRVDSGWFQLFGSKNIIPSIDFLRLTLAQKRVGHAATCTYSRSILLLPQSVSARPFRIFRFPVFTTSVLGYTTFSIPPTTNVPPVFQRPDCPFQQHLISD